MKYILPLLQVDQEHLEHQEIHVFPKVNEYDHIIGYLSSGEYFWYIFYFEHKMVVWPRMRKLREVCVFLSVRM